MALAVIFGTTGFFCAIGIPLLGAFALTQHVPLTLLVLAGVLRGVLHYAEQYCNHFIAFTLLAQIRNIVFAKLRALGPAKLEGRQKGALISLITSDIELLELFYAHTVSPVCIAFLVNAAMTTLLWIQHSALGIAALVFYTVVGTCIPLVVQKRALKAGAVYRMQFATMNAFLLDTLRGLQQSILYKTGEKKLRALEEKSDALSASKKSLALHEGCTAALIDCCVIFASVVMLALSLVLYRNGAIDFGTVVFSVTAMFSSFGPVIAVARLGNSLSQTVAAGARVLALLDESPVVAEVTDGIAIDRAHFSGARLQSVTFAYEHGAEKKYSCMQRTASNAQGAALSATAAQQPDRENVVTNISLDFPVNKITGIQGKSGSGKSTLLKLLMYFWRVDSGTIHVSGNEISTITTSSLREAESYVTQETVLFHDTIENNMRIAKLDATDDEIVEACKKASVHEFIMSLPQGYQTHVAELGDNFSGGERQRLGLARAFLHDGDLLLLDEPTSNLDLYNEHIILDSVRTAAQQKAVVLVSHRESTLLIADFVYKLEVARQS